MKRSLLWILLFSALLSSAQPGGRHSYEFLTLVMSPRVAAMGGELLAIPDGDINVGLWNPSVLNDESTGQLSMNYVNYFDDINYGQAAYGRKIEHGYLSFGARYVNYGTFVETDEFGNIIGEFTGSDVALTAGYGRWLDSSWSIGANFKLIGSSLANYGSIGFATDYAITWHAKESNLNASLVVANVGAQIATYTRSPREPLPFEIKMALSGKPEHAPIRWHITAEHLEQLDLTFEDPNAPSTDPLTGDPIDNSNSLGKKIISHFVLGAELFPGKSFNLRAGYNFRRSQEMSLATRRSGAGFSWGFGLRLRSFRIDYAMATYHVSGASHHFGISTDLNKLF